MRNIYKTIIENMIDGIIVADAEGDITAMNAAALRITGYGELKRAPKTIPRFVNDLGLSTLDGRKIAIDECPLTRALKGEEFTNVEVEFSRCGDTHPHFASFSGTPIYGESGKLHCALVTIRDVTRRKNAEFELLNKERRLRIERDFNKTIIQITGGLIIALDAEGRIRVFNHACEKSTGYSFDEVKGKALWDFLIPPGEKEKAKKMFIGIIKNPLLSKTAMLQKKHHEVRVLAKNGAQRLIRWSNSVLRDENGRASVIVITGIDTTEEAWSRKKIGELNDFLKHKSAELSVAYKELESFSYTVSHDLQSPLHSILACCEVLSMNSASAVQADSKEAIDHIRRAAERMSKIVSDLLMLSRVTRREIRREPVDLSELSASIFEEIRTSSPPRPVEFTVQPGITVNADPGLIRIAVENLIRNAWKFTEKQTGARIEVGALNANGRSEYFVRDNGIGFDMADADKLFKPFQRLHNGKEYGGTGIGLTIVKKIVDKHGGAIWAESGKNKGATFIFRLE